MAHRKGTYEKSQVPFFVARHRIRYTGALIALRYLLRIEASTPERYAKLHPADHSFERRLDCIRLLMKLGYMTGTGVLIGVPGQTKRDLEDDLDFFVREQVHMVGMGPYIPHPDTPLGRAVLNGELQIPPPAERLELALWMIRETRRRLPHINIVAATALETLARPFGQSRLEGRKGVRPP